MKMSPMYEQKKTLNEIDAALMQLRGARGKIVAGDLAGTQARIAFALRNLGNAIDELNAARGLAKDASGFIPALVEKTSP